MTQLKKKLLKNRKHVKILHTLQDQKSGRIRLKIRPLYRSNPMAEWIKQGLSNQVGILNVNANTRTGSLLVFYNPQQFPLKLLIATTEELLKENPRTIQKEYYQRISRTPKARRQIAPPKPWHTLSKKEVLDLYSSSMKKGLSLNKVQHHLKTFGANRLPAHQQRSEWEIFSQQFKNLPVALLLGSAGLSVLTGGVGDSFVIMSVVLINAYLGYVTESSAEKTVNLLSKSNQPNVTVIRNRTPFEIKVENIVLGDILILTPGTHIPADARLLKVDQLQVDESILTGESLPTYKTHLRFKNERLPLADRTNMVFRGTTVTSGSGIAVVVATGTSTELGVIQILMGESQRPDTPLQKQLESLGTKMVAVSLSISGAVFFLGLLRGARFIDTLKTAISLAVAAIPEGLPTVATTTLARGVNRLEKHHLLIRHLDAVETLGNVDVICLDKTGTLTLNEMVVSTIHTFNRSFMMKDNEIFHHDRKTKIFRYPELLQLIQIVALCNDAEILDQNPQEAVKGSATESALLRLAIQSGMHIAKLKSEFPRLSTQYRTENRSYMVTLHKGPDERTLVAVKGRPTEVLSLCTHTMRDGRMRKLSDKDLTEIELTNSKLAAKALRVLGVAYKEVISQEEAQAEHLIWLGLVGLEDPIRPGIKTFIQELHTAGIRTIMVTGDQSATAFAIGKELGLSEGENLEMIDSTRLEQIDPTLLSTLAARAHIFSRVSPSHKLQIVKALQKSGYVVAMTGDGINDGPALKIADIGIAMGGQGSDVARKVADLVVAQDNLPALIHGIQEGRTVHQDIKKAVSYIVSQNLSEILFTFLSVLSGFGEPLTPLQLLWVNLVTDIFPELALSQDPPESDVLQRPPGKPQDPLVSSSDLRKIGFQASVLTAASLMGYLLGIQRYGIGPRAKTMGFITLNSASLLHTFSSRSDRYSIFDRSRLPENKYIPISIGIGFFAEMAATFSPFLRNFLETAPLSGKDLWTSGVSSVLPFLIIESTKFSKNRDFHRQEAS